MIRPVRWLAAASLFLAAPLQAQNPITIRAGRMIDGVGGVTQNVVVTVEIGRAHV